jgi:hypothetical protein
MCRGIVALIGILSFSQIAMADCDTHIGENDTQKAIQAKFDCLVSENQVLRDKVHANSSIRLELKTFGVQSPQDILNLKARLYNWVTSHHGEMSTGNTINQPNVGGHVGSLVIGAGCIEEIGICSVAAAGPDAQATIDAVEAIHSS